MRVPGGEVVQRTLRRRDRARSGGSWSRWRTRRRRRSRSRSSSSIARRVASSSTARCCASTASRCWSLSRAPRAWAVGPGRGRGRDGRPRRAPGPIDAQDGSGRDRTAVPRPAPHAPARRGRQSRAAASRRRARSPGRRRDRARMGAAARTRAPGAACRRRSASWSTPRAPTSPGLPRREPAVVSALEDWGFDDEAAAGWAALGWRARRRADDAIRAADPWSAARRGRRGARSGAVPVGAARRARATSSAASVELLPGFPPDWLGQPLTVESLPLRARAVVVRGALARRPARAAVGGARGYRAPRARARSGVVGEARRPGRRCSPSRRRRCSRWAARERSAGEPVEAPGQFS